jgi:hypothetical protein
MPMAEASSPITTGGVPRNERLTKSLALFAALAAVLVLAIASAAQNQTPPPPSASTPAPTHGVHAISITFDYDFRVTPACTSKVTRNCVQQFVVYDISSGASKTKRYKLFTVPLPPNPTGLVHGIPGAGPPLDFESGKHLLGITALGPAAYPTYESDPQTCTIWVTVP